MNAPIRRLSVVTALLMASLLVSSTFIQFFQAKSLNARDDNRRTLLATYSRERGQIIAGGQTLAKSEPVDNEYKFKRTYPGNSNYAHVTGYYSFYGAGGGLESAENGLLSGSSDRLFYRRVSDLFTGRKPIGASLELTINPEVQRAAIEGLGDQRGAAVAIDPKTGAILAMVSKPSYNPNLLATQDLKALGASYDKLNADRTRPLVNRAIAGNLYPPGSTFKVVTAAAALESGRFQPDSSLPGPARLDLPQTTATIPNHSGSACGPGGRVSLTESLVQSCNTSFAWLGMELGGQAMREQSAKFGMGDEFSVPMRVTPSTFPAETNPPQLAQSSIGQFEVRVTPLQVAMFSAAVANEGRVMEPYLVQSVLGSDLKVIEQTEPNEHSRAMSADTSGKLTEMMTGVVDRGTGRAAQIGGVKVAGKTGTAEHAQDAPPHAWFTGFAPADDPTIAVAVVVEDGGNAGSEAAGGRIAAPIAKDMMEAVVRP